MANYNDKSSYRRDDRTEEQCRANILRCNKLESEYLARFEKEHSEPIEITKIVKMNLDDDKILEASAVKQTIDCEIFYTKDSEARSQMVEVKTVKRIYDGFFKGIKSSQFAQHMRMSGGKNYRVLVFNIADDSYAVLTPKFITEYPIVTNDRMGGKLVYEIPSEAIEWKQLKENK